MAVYTHVDDEALSAFLSAYDVGELLSAKGIAEGVENTNYLVRAEKGIFILTLYEQRVRAEELPFFLNLMAHCADKGLATPRPVPRIAPNQPVTKNRRPSLRGRIIGNPNLCIKADI